MRTRRSTPLVFAAALLVATTAALLGGTLLADDPPSGPVYEPDLPAPTLSGEVPRVVPHFPIWTSGVQQRPFFDGFAWQNFIALAWPADPDAHGVPYRPDDPSVFGDYSGGRVPVWMTWKQSFDLFPADGTTPVAWDAPNGAPDVCKNLDPDPGDHIFLRVNKFDTVGDEVNQAFGGPLPDQTGLFTRYEVRINRAEYDFIRDNGFYDKANWPTGSDIYLPASNEEALGSIEVKAAWRDLAKVPERFHERFFTTNAIVVDPKTCTGPDVAGQPTDCDCSLAKVGLVGLHIAHKTEDFPQWVWATFEQADNVGDDTVTPTPLEMIPSYYDPEAYKKHPGKIPRVNPSSHPGSSRVPAEGDYDPTPINVVRLAQIPTTPQTSSGKDVSTVALNAEYREGVLADSVWKYYFLVGSQWSTLPSAPFPTPQPYISPGDFGCEDGAAPAVGGIPFPQCLLSNTTMETYHQYDSCQNCHQGAQRSGADFSWILANRASDSTASTSSPSDGQGSRDQERP